MIYLILLIGSVDWMTENNELERLDKEAVLALFKVPSPPFPSSTKENHEKDLASPSNI